MTEIEAIKERTYEIIYEAKKIEQDKINQLNERRKGLDYAV
jgi:hypothetical protein